MAIKGTSGDDNLSGTGGDDIFKLGQGGEDSANGKGGDDEFRMGGALSAGDAINGGMGVDTIFLDGNYSSGLVFNATTITNIENMVISSAFTCDLTLNDGNVGAGESLSVDASLVAAGLIFDGSAETDGRFSIIGTIVNDIVTGGSGKDVFNLQGGGVETAAGGKGKDTFNMTSRLTSDDSIDGGRGFDTVTFNGHDLEDDLVLAATTFTNVERLLINGNDSLSLVTDEATVANGATLAIDASIITSVGLDFGVDASAETDGHLDIVTGGGASDCTILAGALSDTVLVSAHSGEYEVTGGGGADDITCTTGQVRLIYSSVSESASTGHDVIHGFNADGFTFIDTPVNVTDYDGETTGTVNLATFDADIGAALNGGFLEIDHAATVNANGGDLDGNSYVVIDVNSDGDYTGGVDYIFEITGYTGTLGMSDFT